jgi:hypothetical protein
VASDKKDKKPVEVAPPTGVLQPGVIKRTEDDEPPPWRAPAIYGGAVVGALLVFGIVSLIGHGVPPKKPLTHQPPEAVAAMDLDDVEGDALAKPIKIPGAGVVPGQPAGQKVVSRAVARGRRFTGGGPAAPVEPPPKPKADATIHYQPRGPAF